MVHHINILRLKVISSALAAIGEKVVFVGGATISLYPDRTTFEVRFTDDVDVIIELVSYSHRIELEERLREIGFAHDTESGIVCRYKIAGIIVDIMPTNEPSIGFLNSWYSEGFKESIEYEIENGIMIKILSAPYFIATKFEAFKGRGQNDGRTNHDFEDIIFVLENRSSVWDEISASKEDLKSYLRLEFLKLLSNPNHFEWIDCHTEPNSIQSTARIIEAIKQFTKE